ncbi:P-loop NTPase [Treponema brennaborense]|uniref:Cobyrinic acid ac-diamide synthase n=1 Tax=Treponema brennaborense (strain DSM 12168 / CIP 105900 / DD5/3) TaxID=906968 RepID=F4LKV3_TREBD|nr:P-loop NTPase [Treponema brennaborense]AEE15564.1 cobyrinic acid ac-diamide synthase [Treponema brennaborense DSM 12168]
MVNIIPVASGKGGVGKSAVSANLAIALAQKGKQVILCDFDFGGANLHTLLGLKNNHAGMGNFIYRQQNSLAELLQETQTENLRFIAGDCLFPGTANMDFFIKKKIMKELSLLPADYVLLDLGGGSSYNILDFYLMTYNSLLVTTPEITSIMNAYSFLKASVFRFFTQQFPAKSAERKAVADFIQSVLTGTESSFTALIETICRSYPESGEKARLELERFNPQVVLNCGSSAQDLEMGRRLRSLVRTKLNIRMDFIGFIPKDPNVPVAVARRTPLYLLEPQSPFSIGIGRTAERMLAYEYGVNDTLVPDEEDGDLEQLKSEYIAAAQET